MIARPSTNDLPSPKSLTIKCKTNITSIPKIFKGHQPRDQIRHHILCWAPLGSCMNNHEGGYRNLRPGERGLVSYCLRRRGFDVCRASCWEVHWVF